LGVQGLTMDETPQQYNFIITATQAGMRLDKALTALLPAVSRSRIQALIHEGFATLSGAIITSPAVSVKQGDALTFELPPPVESMMTLAPHITLDIFFEDEHMLVVNKQAGLTVHPGAGCYQDTLANALLSHCGSSLSGIGGVTRPGIVHRLDRDTSGLMVVAKNDAAHHHLSEQIANRTLKRVYAAMCWGVPSPASGTITGNIDRSLKDRTKMALVKTGGREATTHYRTEEPFGFASYVACKLQTGRTHQIRVHFTHQGWPIIGDPVYGKPSAKGIPVEVTNYLQHFNRQALHSHKIGFTHPVSGELMEFTAPLPADMAQLLAILRSLA